MGGAKEGGARAANMRGVGIELSYLPGLHLLGGVRDNFIHTRLTGHTLNW